MSIEPTTEQDLELEPGDAEQVVGGKKQKKRITHRAVPAAAPMIVVTGTHVPGDTGSVDAGPDPNEAEDC
jgi:hypothetical protein